MLNKYLSDDAVKMLQNAFFHEVENSAIYRTISVWLNSKGLVNLSDYYEKWATEEFEHQKWVKEFMINLDVPIATGQITVEDYKLDNELIQFMNATILREDSTTEIYHQMSMYALDMNDKGSALLLDFSQKMNHEQTEETDKALTLYAKINNLGNNWGMAQIFDNGFK
jgi:ferritin